MPTGIQLTIGTVHVRAVRGCRNQQPKLRWGPQWRRNLACCDNLR